jgi:hypothetical protein
MIPRTTRDERGSDGDGYRPGVRDGDRLGRGRGERRRLSGRAGQAGSRCLLKADVGEEAGVGAEGQSQQPQRLVGGDTDRGRSGPRRVQLDDAGSPTGVVAVVGYIRPDLVGGPVDLYAAHHPSTLPTTRTSASRSASDPVTTASSIRSARYERRRVRLVTASLRGPRPFAACFLAWPVARWQGGQSRPKGSSGRSGTLTRGFGS